MTDGKTTKFIMKDDKVCEYNQTWITKNNPGMNQWIEEKDIMAKYFAPEGKNAQNYSNSTKTMPQWAWLVEGRDYVIYDEYERPACEWDIGTS